MVRLALVAFLVVSLPAPASGQGLFDSFAKGEAAGRRSAESRREEARRQAEFEQGQQEATARTAERREWLAACVQARNAGLDWANAALQSDSAAIGESPARTAADSAAIVARDAQRRMQVTDGYARCISAQN